MRPVKGGKQHARPKPMKTPTAPAAPVTSQVNGAALVSPTEATAGAGGRKKRKKKGKGRSEGDVGVEVTMQLGLNDDLPELERFKAPSPFTHTHTKLSPDLDAVHRSTTAPLNSLSTAARHGVEQLAATVSATANESQRTYDELRKSLYWNAALATTVQNEMRKGFASIPTLQNFVQKAEANPDWEGRKLYDALQNFLQASPFPMSIQDIMKTNGASAPDADTKAFPDDLSLTQALEQLVTRKDSGEMGEKAALPHKAYEGEVGGFFGEIDIYSEDEVDERRGNGDGINALSWDNCEVDEEENQLPGAYPFEEVYPAERVRMPVKKSRNRRKAEDGLSDPAPAGTVTVPTDPEDTKSDSPPHNITTPPDQTMAPARNAPPPSSRAAGKQPMSYPPTAPTTAATNTTNTAPPRSARAAAKAPAPPPQTYANHSHPHHNPSPPVSNASAPQKHRPPGGSSGGANAKSNSKIWSTNTSEERERIKEFWLGLSEKDRRHLVEIEKETVLKRMKEQQKHSCTCAVCGRKRNAIEEELEVLYDAYYEELEQYANYQQRYASSGGTLPPPPGPGPFPGSVELDKDGHPVGPGKTHTHSHPPSARIKPANALTNGPKKGMVESEFEEDPDVEDYEEDDYEDDEEEDEEDEEDDLDAEDDIEIRNRTRSLAARDRNRGSANGKANGRDSIFNFGSSLTVTGPGNILTVADDLLKNDGQKFLEMMEQLAERRMQREEDAARGVEDDSDDEEDEEGDEGEEDEEDEDDEDEDDDEVAMTEEQKIAEGKRMFSIFAARMFEQRVLQAYREKVAQERQKQLLQELEEEENAKSQREAKKAKENQKKKDKKRQQKQAKEEERAAKAAEKAAEEAALREKQRKLEDEQRRKREEERIKREAAKKAVEEERFKREEERRKRLAEEKEQQAERERKRREKEERRRAEQREREERERKAREEREAKLAVERAEKAKKDQQEKEEREKRLAKEKEEREKSEREAKERQAKEQQQQARSSAAKARAPSSPRVNATASGSRQQQQQNAAPKKILNKSSNQPVAPVPGPAAPAQPVRQPSRPTVSTPQQNQAPQQSVASPTVPASVPPSTPTFPQSVTLGNGILPPMVSPQRPPFPPGAGMPGYGGFMQQIPVQPLGSSPMPRPPFTGPPAPFDPGYGRGLAPAAPIGPPSKVALNNPLASPIMPLGSGAPNRRMSSAADPGPITRPTPVIAPIAPIARPNTNGVNGDSSGSAPGSGGASPSRRSPSPKGVLGSSALAADDDEVVAMPSMRRVAPGPVGQGWHSPRGSVATSTPWTSAPPNYSPSRAAPGSNLGGMAGLGVGVGSWAQTSILGNPGAPGANLNDSWATHNAFFGGSPYGQSHHSAATPPPHSTGN